MAVYTFTIGGTPRAMLIEGGQIQQTVNGVDTFSGVVRSLDGLYRPLPNDTILIAEDASTIYGGLIEEVVEVGANNAGNTDGLRLRISAKDFSQYAARRIVSETLAAGTLKSMLTTLVTTYFATYGVSLHASQSNGPSLPQFIFTRRKGNETLDDLAASAGYIWKIDANKKLRMWAPGDIAASFDVVDGDGHAILDVEVDTTRNDAYANRIYVLVTGAGPATSTETFTAADGVTSGQYVYFTTKYPATDDINAAWPNELLINGVPLGPIFWFDTPPVPVGFSWVWDYANHRLRYDTLAGSGPLDFPTGGDTIEVTYAIGYPFTVQADDAVGQAAYGLWERVLERADPLTLEAAQALADGALLQESPVLKRAIYQTMESGLGVGETQTITVARRDLSDSMLVTEFTTEWLTSTVAKRTVTAMQSLVAQSTYRATYDQMLKVGGGTAVEAGGSGAVPGEPVTAVQFNRDHGFAGSGAFIFEEFEKRVTVDGSL